MVSYIGELQLINLSDYISPSAYRVMGNAWMGHEKNLFQQEIGQNPQRKKIIWPIDDYYIWWVL